jgi:hypothetical protein
MAGKKNRASKFSDAFKKIDALSDAREIIVRAVVIIRQSVTDDDEQEWIFDACDFLGVEDAEDV